MNIKSDRLNGTFSHAVTSFVDGGKRRKAMCDYSLENVASRPAAISDKLISTKFPNAITRGFSATDNPDVAVCLLPGTELAFDNEVVVDAAYPLLPRIKMSTRVARFRRINPENPHAHHDALEFADGQVVTLARLVPGQTASILQLPVDPEAPAHTHETHVQQRETV
jgi:hypothetical protein